MACQSNPKQVPNCVPTFQNRSEYGPKDLKTLILTQLDEPKIFTDKLTSWTDAVEWTPTKLAGELAGITTLFKVYPKRETNLQVRKSRRAVFETDCSYISATLADFDEWLESGKQTDREEHSECSEGKKAKYHSVEEADIARNPLLEYPSDQYWLYADYKYMSELCDRAPHLKDAVSWDMFGFEGRTGNDSTLWVGSGGAFTPCHYDTYGINLVAQIFGKKRWVLIPAAEYASMYPTRIPYEESSVFSLVNVTEPDLDKYPKFKNVKCFEVFISL